MTVDRPYREALSLDEAREQIEFGAGKSFDPTVVEAFRRAWNEVSEVFTRSHQSDSIKALAPEFESAEENALAPPRA